MVSKFLKNARLALIASAGATAILCSAPAMAQARDYNVPAQSAQRAVAALAKQGNVQILLPGRTARSIRTKAVRGSMSIEEALEAMLAGTGLRAQKTGAQTWTIVPFGAAQSQTNPSPPGTGAASSASSRGNDDLSSSEEIVVTAQKRTERLVDVPQSISVLSGETLARQGATQFRDFADTVPGLTFSTAGAGYTQVVLRGVTLGLGTSSTVGVYVDEVPYGSSTSLAQGSQVALDVGLFDLDRIEVLRGPQGTLYGASSMGGLLKYVTKTPNSDRLGLQAQGGVTSTAHGGVGYNGAAALNVPLVEDILSLRASAYYSHDGGFIDNERSGRKDVDRANIYGGRLDVLFTPTDELSIRVGGFVQDIDREDSATADYDLSGIPITDSLSQRRNVAEFLRQQFRLASATISYDFGGASLTSISSYQYARTRLNFDFTGSGIADYIVSLGRTIDAVALPQELGLKKFTQELRLASDSGVPLEWLVGAFYTHERSENIQGLDISNAGLTLPNDIFNLSAPSTYKEYAVFGDLTWNASDKLHVTAGLRYARNHQTYRQFGSGAFASDLPTTRSKEGVLTYLGNVRYSFSRNTSLYVRYATGFRPGGPNFSANDPVTGDPLFGPFKSDKLKSYEVGFKAETSDRTFGIDAAAYVLTWSNLQIGVFRGGLSGLDNSVASDARIKGAELTLTARPIPQFVVTGAFAYQDAYMTDDEPNLGTVKNQRLPTVPRFTAALNADYDFSNGSLRPTIGATLRFVSDRPSDFGNSYRLPDYTAVNLRAGITVGPADIQLFARNIFDVRGQLSSTIGRSVGAVQVALIQPRTIGILAKTRF